jgi:RsiW-degrading membrane proteinase PrsW (M82 family)
MRSGGQWLAALALLVGVVFAWPTYVRYFGLHPGPMTAAMAIALTMYLPSVWAIRRLDRDEPEPPWLFWGSIVFVIFFAPITARTMHGIIDAGLLQYWVVVGPFEELTKLLPLLLIVWFAPRYIDSMRDCIVYGALGGLGFAIVEFGAVFATGGYPEQGWANLLSAVPGRWALGTESHIVWGAVSGVAIGYVWTNRGRGFSIPIGLTILVLVVATHGLNDLYGKFIGPLAMVLLIEPARAAGIDLASLAGDSPLTAALLVYSAVANTLVMNLLLWPVLVWGIRRSRQFDTQPRPSRVTLPTGN